MNREPVMQLRAFANSKVGDHKTQLTFHDLQAGWREGEDINADTITSEIHLTHPDVGELVIGLKASAIDLLCSVLEDAKARRATRKPQ